MDSVIKDDFGVPSYGPISGPAYKKQAYLKPATEEVMGKLSYPVIEEENVELPPTETPSEIPEEPASTDSDEKGLRPKQFTWVEEGLFATCCTPVSPTHHEHYKWLIENQFNHIVSLEPWTPKLVKHHNYDLADTLIRVPNYSAPSLDQIEQIFKIIDAENMKGKAVVVTCKSAEGSSAVVAACHLIRKYRYGCGDAIEDVRKMLAGAENCLPRPYYENKVWEYQMMRLQDGFSGHWFPTVVAQKQVVKGDRSGNYAYEPAVNDVNNLWALHPHHSKSVYREQI